MNIAPNMCARREGDATSSTLASETIVLRHLTLEAALGGRSWEPCGRLAQMASHGRPKRKYYSPNKALAAEGFLLVLYRIALVGTDFPSVSASAWESCQQPVDQDFRSGSALAWVPKLRYLAQSCQ